MCGVRPWHVLHRTTIWFEIQASLLSILPRNDVARDKVRLGNGSELGTDGSLPDTPQRGVPANALARRLDHDKHAGIHARRHDFTGMREDLSRSYHTRLVRFGIPVQVGTPKLMRRILVSGCTAAVLLVLAVFPINRLAFLVAVGSRVTSAAFLQGCPHRVSRLGAQGAHC